MVHRSQVLLSRVGVQTSHSSLSNFSDIHLARQTLSCYQNKTIHLFQIFSRHHRMGSLDTFFLPPEWKRSMFPRTASCNLFVWRYVLEGFAFRHGEEALLGLQDLYYPQNHVLYHHLCTYHRMHFLCHRDEPLKQPNIWAFRLKSSQLLSR